MPDLRDAIRTDRLTGALAGLGVWAAIVALPGTAAAHSPIDGIGTFYNGLLHPLVTPAHLLVLVGLSLALGQQGGPASRLGLLLLVVAFVGGLGAAMVANLSPPPTSGLLVLAALVGSTVTIQRPLPRWLIAAAAVVAGLLMGLDSRPESAGPRDTALALAGMCSGTALAASLIAGTCLTLERAWMRIGVRVVGAWIVAVSVLMLALLLQSGRPTLTLWIAAPARAGAAG